MDKKLLEKKLSKKAYNVTQKGATEPPGSGSLLHEKRSGVYHCVVCNTPLFSADTKFESGTGWPSFYDLAKNDAVILRDDTSGGMKRTEVVCATCDAHLGHLFEDAPQTPTGKRYCINSCALNFNPKE